MGKFVFTVQGEGRGHLTQAISFTQIAQEAGHEVVGYAVGSFQGRKIPSFFLDFIGDTPLLQYNSPSIIFGNGKSVQLAKTAMQAVTNFKTFWNSATQLEAFIEDDLMALFISNDSCTEIISTINQQCAQFSDDNYSAILYQIGVEKWL